MKFYSYDETIDGKETTYWFTSKAEANKERNAAMKFERQKSKERKELRGTDEWEDMALKDSAYFDPAAHSEIVCHQITPTKKGILQFLNTINRY